MVRTREGGNSHLQESTLKPSEFTLRLVQAFLKVSQKTLSGADGVAIPLLRKSWDVFAFTGVPLFIAV